MKIIILGAFLLLAGCANNAIIDNQLGVNRDLQPDYVDVNMVADCRALRTTSQTPSWYADIFWPSRSVVITVECNN